MSGCDKIDVVAAQALEAKHHVRQVFVFEDLSSAFKRNGPILAKDTAEIAVGKKYRA
jgi:hypothetical protein